MQALMVNPLGKVFDLDAVKNYMEALLSSWKASQSVSRPWWKFWAGLDLKSATGFFLVSIDDLVGIVQNLLQLGPDKKATVLDALSKIYDVIIVGSAPIWLKPVVTMMKGFIINTVCSMFIDWIVSKYNAGNWSMEATNGTETKPNQV